MANFEYEVVEESSDGAHAYFKRRGNEDQNFFKDEIQAMLNKMGKEGWILCGIIGSFDIPTRYLFKRAASGAVPIEYLVIDEDFPAPDQMAYLLCSPNGQPFYDGALSEHEPDILERDVLERYGQDWQLCFVYVAHSFGKIYHGDGITNEKVFVLMRPRKTN